jgi:hypothetical protein
MQGQMARSATTCLIQGWVRVSECGFLRGHLLCDGLLAPCSCYGWTWWLHEHATGSSVQPVQDSFSASVTLFAFTCLTCADRV